MGPGVCLRFTGVGEVNKDAIKCAVFNKLTQLCLQLINQKLPH